MKIKVGLFLLAALLLFLEACSLSTSVDTNNFFPQTVGDYKRDEVKQGNNNSWFYADYRKPNVEIFYGFGPYSTAQEAQTQVTNKKFCDSADAVKEGTLKILKEEILKDKTGKEIGRILICREAVKDTYKDTVGNYKYTITLSNDKSYIYLNGRESSLADLTNFAETLPLNSQVDFTALNLQALVAANSSTSASADELIRLNPPVKLAKEPYIKGKVLIASQTFSGISSSENSDGIIFFDKRFEKYGLTQDLVADSYNEAETVIQIACSKGERLGDYVTKDAMQKKFPAYASNCKISVIDKTIPAIIAQKNLVGTYLSEEEKFNDLDKAVRASPPYVEIGTFIKNLPKR